MSANSAIVDSEDDLEDEAEEEAPESASIADDDQATDNVGDASVEINVEALLTELEADGLLSSAAHAHDSKKRLDDIMEKRRSRRDLEDFDDYDV
jgi:hypothetical protein